MYAEVHLELADNSCQYTSQIGLHCMLHCTVDICTTQQHRFLSGCTTSMEDRPEALVIDRLISLGTENVLV